MSENRSRANTNRANAGGSNLPVPNAPGSLAGVARWAARIIAIGFIVLFLIYFFSGGGINEANNLNSPEKVRLTFVPIVFTIGFIMSWKKERLGGALMVLSVVGFNLVRMIFKRELLGTPEFLFLLIPGLLLLLLPWISGQEGKDT